MGCFIKQILRFVIFSSALVVSQVRADQNNPELNGLFNQLHETVDMVVAMGLTREIWDNWYQHDDPDVEALMEKGQTSIRSAKYNDALGYFSEIIQLDPNFAEGWNRRATVYFLMGEYELSTSDVAETLEREPRHFGALSGQGMIYIQLRDVANALEYMERAIEENPHMPRVKNSIENLKKISEDEII